MASRYWVGGTGSWDLAATTHWSATSGGAGGASVPTNADDVFFDANSGGGVVTLLTATTLPVRNLVLTGFTGSITNGGGSAVLQVNGPVFTHSATITLYQITTTFNYLAGSTLVTSVGKSFTTVNLNTGSAISLQDAMTIGGTLTAGGSITTNNFAFTVGTFGGSNGNTRTYNFGSSAITVTGSWTTATVAGLTVSPNTATVTLSGAAPSFTSGAKDWNGLSVVFTGTGAGTKTFAGGGGTYKALTFTVAAATGALVITGANTFTTLSVGSGRTLTLPASTVTTVGTANLNGASGSLLTVNSSTAGTRATLTKTGGGTVAASYLALADIAATPASTFYAGTHSTDSGDNTGWTFADVPSSTFAEGWGYALV